MNVKIPSAQQLKHWIIFVLGLAAAAVAAIDPTNLPGTYRTGLTIAAAIILSVERYVSDPSTGTPTTAPAPILAATNPPT